MLFIFLSLLSFSGLAMEASGAGASAPDVSAVAQSSSQVVVHPPLVTVALEGASGGGLGTHPTTSETVPPISEEQNPYSVLFIAFDKAFRRVPISDGDPLPTNVRASLEKLGITGASEEPKTLYHSKSKFVDFLQVPLTTRNPVYSIDKVRYRNQKRAEYRDLVKRDISKSCSIFLKCLDLDQAQDENEKKKVYLFLQQIYSEDNVKLNSFRELHHILIKQDITLGLKTILDEYKARSLSEKLWGLSGMIIKIPAGIVSIWSGWAQLKSAYTSAHCFDDTLPLYYPLNTTISAIPQEPFNLTCFSEIVINGTVTPPYCLGSKMVDCATLSPPKYAPSVALIVGGGASLISGIWDLFGSPQIYTDIKTLLNKGSRESGILFDEKALINTIHAAVIKVEDLSRHEELIKDTLSLVKALLPRSGHVDVITKVKDSLEDKTRVIIGRL